MTSQNRQSVGRTRIQRWFRAITILVPTVIVVLFIMALFTVFALDLLEFFPNDILYDYVDSNTVAPLVQRNSTLIVTQTESSLPVSFDLDASMTAPGFSKGDESLLLQIDKLSVDYNFINYQPSQNDFYIQVGEDFQLCIDDIVYASVRIFSDAVYFEPPASLLSLQTLHNPECIAVKGGSSGTVTPNLAETSLILRDFLDSYDYPYDDITADFVPVLMYSLVKDGHRFQAYALASGLWLDVTGLRTNNWKLQLAFEKVHISDDIQKSAGFILAGEGQTNIDTILHLSLSRPNLYKHVYPLIFTVIAILIVLLSFLNDLASLIEAVAAIIFGIFGLRGVLIPSQLEGRTIWDGVILAMYFLLAVVFILRILRNIPIPPPKEAAIVREPLPFDSLPQPSPGDVNPINQKSLFRNILDKFT